MRYRIALCGFSEFEYRAMHFSFQHPSGFRESQYDLVDALADADFAVVDADSVPAVKGVVQSGRLAQAVFVGHDAPAGAARHLRRPIDPSRILRTLDELTQRPPSQAAAEPVDLHHPDDPRELPTLIDIVNLPQAPIEAAAVVPPPLPNTGRAAARAKARRARLAQTGQAASGAAEPLRDALVLDADEPANTLLCALLERFGFQAHAVGSVAQATEQLAQRPFAAIFLDISLDDDAGIGLLQQIRALPRPWPHTNPAVLLTSARLDPSDRVRAALVGLGEPLGKPVSRGDIARALESAGVALPADARRQ